MIFPGKKEKRKKQQRGSSRGSPAGHMNPLNARLHQQRRRRVCACRAARGNDGGSQAFLKCMIMIITMCVPPADCSHEELEGGGGETLPRCRGEEREINKEIGNESYVML